MCIIAAKPSGVDMPTKTDFDNMWLHNSDGAGFMYALNNKVHIEKGFMKKKDFEKAIKHLGKRINLKDTPIIFHFRITTHGGTVSSNTHPFPVSDSVGMLQKLKCNTDLGVAHNGIITSVTPRKGISDTMEYIITQLAPLYKGVQNFLDNPNLMTLIENATESKLCFLKANGDIYTIGKFVEHNGIKYSNTSYEPYTSVYSKYAGSYSGCYSWDDYGYRGFPNPSQDAKELKGHYLQELVKPLFQADGNFVTDSAGSMLIDDGYYVVDEDGQAYVYDVEYDAYVMMGDAYGTNLDGSIVVASDDDVDSYLDYVFIPDDAQSSLFGYSDYDVNAAIKSYEGRK